MHTKTSPKDKKPSGRAARRKPGSARDPSVVPRATSSHDEDDVFMAGGSKDGVAFGRCGGRIMSSRLEQNVCDMLSRRGIAHSHSPRHFEVQLDRETVAAYAPMIVLRGRGREGKTVVIEGVEQAADATLEKIRAFRKKYGVEFYVSFIAGEEVLDEIPFDTYDEGVAMTEAHTLVNRLAE